MVVSESGNGKPDGIPWPLVVRPNFKLTSPSSFLPIMPTSHIESLMHERWGAGLVMYRYEGLCSVVQQRADVLYTTNCKSPRLTRCSAPLRLLADAFDHQSSCAVWPARSRFLRRSKTLHFNGGMGVLHRHFTPSVTRILSLADQSSDSGPCRK